MITVWSWQCGAFEKLFFSPNFSYLLFFPQQPHRNYVMAKIQLFSHYHAQQRWPSEVTQLYSIIQQISFTDWTEHSGPCLFCYPKDEMTPPLEEAPVPSWMGATTWGAGQSKMVVPCSHTSLFFTPAIIHTHRRKLLKKDSRNLRQWKHKLGRIP